MSLPLPRSSGRLGEMGIIFLVLALALTGFGILMIYSASSITALTSPDLGNNPAYYAIRQAVYAVVGLATAFVIWRTDYHVWTQTLRIPIWVGIVLLLLAVLTSAAGQDAYGATRWIGIGPVSLQPSEFAKAVALLISAELLQEYFEEGSLTLGQLGLWGGVLLGIPLLLILRQPDKGTVAIIGATVVVMLFLAGMSLKVTGIIAAVGVAGILFLGFHDEYSRARIDMVMNPWIDPYGAGYQLIQGFYAFGSGGLFGVGLGMSRQKYSYLPMAHNDFILAVIGEELGFVGMMVMLIAFAALVWLGFRIARNAPDLSGRLLAAGSVTMLTIQLMINAGGVLGLIPLSGKPVPFISYGGSSILSTLIIVGLVLSVARASEATSAQTSRGFAVVEGSSPSGFRVISGGGSTRTPESIRRGREVEDLRGGRVSYNANGTRRIDLGRSSTERLRGR